MPTTSASSRYFSRQSSNTILLIFFKISGMVTLFGRVLRSSSWQLVRPRFEWHSLPEFLFPLPFILPGVGFGTVCYISIEPSSHAFLFMQLSSSSINMFPLSSSACAICYIHFFRNLPFFPFVIFLASCTTIIILFSSIPIKYSY